MLPADLEIINVLSEDCCEKLAHSVLTYCVNLWDEWFPNQDGLRKIRVHWISSGISKLHADIVSVCEVPFLKRFVTVEKS